MARLKPCRCYKAGYEESPAKAVPLLQHVDGCGKDGFAHILKR